VTTGRCWRATTEVYARMSRPSSFAGPRAIACLGLLALLAACSGGGSRTSSSVEAARYAAQARGNYAPPGPPGDPWGPYITEASNRFDVPDTWIRAVMHVESGGHEYLNGQLITSGAGAMGLMQVMPETYDELRQQYSLSDDPYDPHNNILAGTAYIREMYDIYGAPGFLAAYNAGPARLDDYLSNNRPLPDETRRYVAMIGPAIEGTSPRSRSPAEQYAMNTLPINIPPGPRYGRGTQYLANRNSGGGAPVRPVQVAQLPEPPPSRPEQQRQQVALASPPPPQPRGGFRLVPVANAEALPERTGGPRTGGWAIQIGAFGKEAQAHSAIGTAKVHAHEMLTAARPMVQPVRETHGTLYRARLTGLSREAAVQACQKLRGHGACIVLSPESQS
jgi:cell division septation protein DedD